jgi:hypothetical protein
MFACPSHSCTLAISAWWSSALVAAVARSECFLLRLLLLGLGRNGTENWVKDSIHRNAEWRPSPSGPMRPAASGQSNRELSQKRALAPVHQRTINSLRHNDAGSFTRSFTLLMGKTIRSLLYVYTCGVAFCLRSGVVIFSVSVNRP